MAHLGEGDDDDIYSSSNLIKNTIGIDAVLDGHSHSTIESRNIKNKDNQNVVLSSTGSNSQNLGQLVIDTNSTATIDDDTLSTKLLSSNEITDNFKNSSYQKTNSLINEKNEELQATLKKVVATSSVDLTINKRNGFRGIRDRETNLGDFVADAYRIVMDADIGLSNGGGIRASINKGDITYSDLISVHPFGNMMCVVKATGQEIIDCIEFAARKAAIECDDVSSGYAIDENGGWLQVSGISYCVDLCTPSSAEQDANGMFTTVNGKYRISNVLVLDKSTGLYLPIDLKKEYTVASSNYLIKNAGDGNNVFEDNELLQDESMLDNQCLITYMTDYLNSNVPTYYENIEGQGRIKFLLGSHNVCTFGDWNVISTSSSENTTTKIRYCSICNKAEIKTFINENSEQATQPITQENETTTNIISSTTTSKADANASLKSPNTGNDNVVFIPLIAIASTFVLVQIIMIKRKRNKE